MTDVILGGILMSGGSGFKISTLLKSLQGSLNNWVQWIVTIVGVVMVGFGIYKLAKGLISHGKGQPTNWVIVFALIIVGGVMMGSGGWNLLGDISKGGKATIDDFNAGNPDTTTVGHDSAFGTILNPFDDIQIPGLELQFPSF